MSTIQIETLGCRLNQIESESVARIFVDNGFSVCMDGVTAKTITDKSTLLCIINTCTVTQKAEQKARRVIRLLLKNFPASVVIVTGCYAQVSPDEIKKMDERVCVLEGQIKSRLAKIPQCLTDFLKNNNWNPKNFAGQITKNIFEVPAEKPGFPENSFKLSTSNFIAHARASLKIQDGCNNACSYCAIHFARGHSVSIDVQTAIDRVKELECAGQTEVVITTVNIAQYKADFNGETINFAKLLRILLSNTQKIAFRISSLYPEIVDDEFCAVIANPRVRPHFHISVQSGSNKILKAMNRVYKMEDVDLACKKLRKAKPNAFIACDIITGFPGETQEDFLQTMNLCINCNFSWVHAFPFSERPGTPAAKMNQKVPQSESGHRAKQLTEWAINQKVNYIKNFTGKTLQAVVETNNHAMTENFIHCELTNATVEMQNKSVTVKIISALPQKIIKGGEIEALAEVLE